MGRKPVVGGNWKCNLDAAGAKALVESLNGMDCTGCDVIVAPIALHIPTVVAGIKKDIAVSAQNCNFKGNGAFTGECSADQIKDIGCQWVILGHSERRQYFKEDDDLLKTKLEYALSKGLKVMYCIGESLQEREAGKTLDVCKTQLEKVKDVLKADTCVIAYEPIWAIGTGVTATPEQAQETHKQIRDWIATTHADLAANIRIQYGGSANAANAPTLSACPDIDGFLVGGASLKPEFADIIKAIAAAKK
uniref:Triosephosphate isomerase n=1 Tax=Hemiselmis tepida TaxID=464990 RepID=A0A7S0VJ32_9CRYP|mmetsp:Transcript_18165/g.45780  ORF Transcript_18165/g.45780 Transcript_18165/m.45780 type:complete len:249 (+) Transcript_18165:43-789(+)|eukprot:CAMPEP_0174926862 /NCGR_PEP_ID=MMETSP1355-20121228/15515_1 /TAXON_ID=464990 /ORGANISM="Hemiselmis tepida, Strain CCMP443" /LENGTH=248 /DNA_ID=CAMNT_0016172929 /DNA_START=43 /DNA_END=789 /DNA_ORIENTATION=+